MAMVVNINRVGLDGIAPVSLKYIELISFQYNRPL